MKIQAEENALRHLAKISDGDARKALNALEIAALTTAPDKKGVVRIDLAAAEQSIQKKAVVYDDEDAHYDTISAFIKSMRGSDPDAALYWLAKMIHAGEDPRFIARRIVICAAEDVGLADPMALVLANAALSASEFVGWPEARIPLAEATIYIATANKSNSAIAAIDAALADVKSGRTIAGAGAFARRKLQGRGTARPRPGLPIRTRRQGSFCRAGLSGRGQDLLRADRTGRGKENQGTRREMAGGIWRSTKERSLTADGQGRNEHDKHRSQRRTSAEESARQLKNISPAMRAARIRATSRSAEGAIILSKRAGGFVFRAAAGRD